MSKDESCNEQVPGRPKEASATVYLVEELGDARLRCDQLVRYIAEGVRLVESSPQKEKFYETAGHLLQAVPVTLFKLQKALQAVALAANRIDYDELRTELRPEKVEQLEKVLEDARIRQINRHSEPLMTPQQVAAKLRQIAATTRDFQLPQDEVVTLIAALERGQKTADTLELADRLDDLAEVLVATDAAEGLARVAAGNWIGPAIKNPGALHKHFGIPEDETIPTGKIESELKKLKSKEGGLSDAEKKLQKQLNMALTLRGPKVPPPKGKKEAQDENRPSRFRLAAVLRRLVGDVHVAGHLAILSKDKQAIPPGIAAEDDEDKEGCEKRAVPPGIAGKKAADPNIGRLERVISNTEEQLKVMKHALDLYKRDPGRYKPQLDNFANAAGSLMTTAKMGLRTLGHKIAGEAEGDFWKNAADSVVHAALLKSWNSGQKDAQGAFNSITRGSTGVMDPDEARAVEALIEDRLSNAVEQMFASASALKSDVRVVEHYAQTKALTHTTKLIRDTAGNLSSAFYWMGFTSSLAALSPDLADAYGIKTASGGESKQTKFEEGKPADPTKNMSPEDKAKWEKANEENKDKFKSAAFDFDRAMAQAKRKLALDVIAPLKGLAKLVDDGVFTMVRGEPEQNFKIPGNVNAALASAQEVMSDLTDIDNWATRSASDSWKVEAAAELKTKFDPSYKQQLGLMTKNPPKIENREGMTVIEVFSPFVKKYIPMVEHLSAEEAQKDLGVWIKAHRETLQSLRAAIKADKTAAEDWKAPEARTARFEEGEDADKDNDGAPDNLKGKAEDEWKANTEKHKDKFKGKDAAEDWKAPEAKTVTAALKPKDKKVIDAFYEKSTAEGYLLSTDGTKLSKHGMGGGTFAEWKGGKIVVDPSRPHVKSDEEIIRYMKKSIPGGSLADHPNLRKTAEEEKQTKFEEGKPADPTKNMTEEEAKEWKANTEKHKDKFKKDANMLEGLGIDPEHAKALNEAGRRNHEAIYGDDWKA